ncbi:MAG: hypothetical protein OXE50_00505 [Chloroflexi bacterium]|nr:hypothetical protein [Chloroflexota bacterium]
MLHITIEQVDSRAEGFLMATIEDSIGIYVPALGRGGPSITITADSYTPIPDFLRQIADDLSDPGWVEEERARQREMQERFSRSAPAANDLPF